MDDPNEKPTATAPEGELERDDVTGEAHVDETEFDADARHLKWFETVYQGDQVPQLTFRAVLMGGLLGSLMSISNLYTMVKLGWGFAVAITACVLSYCIWNALRLVFRKLSPMSILENNCMQSTASAAGYSTGSTIATAFGAHLLITGHQVPWQILMPWTLITALLGVFLAVPMKRQMINQEQLAFPTGIAAAATLKSLYSQSREAVLQAYALVAALVVGAVVGLLRTGEFAWQKAMGLKIPELLQFSFPVKGGMLPGLGFEPSVMLISAGMIVGLRVALSMFAGSCLLYFVVAPMMLESGDIEAPAKLLKWALWTGTALMVTSGLASFGLQWKTIVRSFSAMGGGAKNSALQKELAAADAIEVPFKWCLIGVIPLAIIMAILEYVAFSISIPLGLLSVATSFILGLVACRSTGETDVTPIGAMGKITQLVYAALSPKNIVVNLMTASVTANTAIASADLLTDLKSGYILGANPRKQFFAQLVGVFFGTVAIVPAWYLMFPTKEILESYNPPNTNLWRAVAEALSVGIQAVPVSARYGLLIGGVLGIVIALAEHFFPKARKYLPSAMGLGLSWIMVFANSLAFLIGAIIAEVWTRTHKKTADAYIIPIASGAIAGESLICAFIAMLAAYSALAHH